MIDKFIEGVIYPIPPSFKNNSLDHDEILKYLGYLHDHGAKTVLVTAGTSRLNLLSDDEIIDFNETCSKFHGNIIVGLPPIANRNAINYINKINSNNNIDAVLALYPDRYYDDKSIKNYFYWLADRFSPPLIVHGMPMRRASGGTYEYTINLVNAIKQHKNIIGIKEESSTFNGAYDISNTADKNFLVFPAGGSCRRFLIAYPRGAQTFLGGIGNIFPELEEAFFKAITSHDMNLAYKVVTKFEDPLFKIFQPIGWHKALQEALNYKKLLITENRAPFSKITKSQQGKIHRVIDDIEIRWNND